MSRARFAANVVGFQVAWFALVLSAAAGRAALGVAVAGAAIAAHLLLQPAPPREAQALLGVAAMGTAWDAVPIALGWIHYGGAAAGGFAPPHWLAVLWLAFATTLNGALRWLQGRWLVAALIGAVGGPLCYLAGEQLGALAIVSPAGTAAQAVAWALLLPASSWLAARLARGSAQVGERVHV